MPPLMMLRQRLLLFALAAIAIIVVFMPDPVLFRPLFPSTPSSSSRGSNAAHSNILSLNVIPEDVPSAPVEYHKHLVNNHAQKYLDQKYYHLFHRLEFEREGITCAPDYHSCGSLPAPTSSLPCCNPQSYCYRRPPYFSQCRPRDELSQSRALSRFEGSRDTVRQCAIAWARCSDTVSCCSPSHQCVNIAPFYTVCVSSSALQFLLTLRYSRTPVRVGQV